MAFAKNPIIEEAPTCLVCGVVVYDGLIVCSATCEDISTLAGQRREPLLDWAEGDSDQSWWEEQHNYKIGA